MKLVQLFIDTFVITNVKVKWLDEVSDGLKNMLRGIE